MAKNLVVCLDGTDNQFCESNTNVVRVFQSLVHDPIRQVAYYSPGVGTIWEPGTLTRIARKFQMVLGLAFGLGATRNVLEAYRFLMRYYKKGDRIFIFGFSRGALEARGLAGLISKCGLLRPELECLIYYADRIYKDVEADSNVVKSFKATFSRSPDIQFLGLWDTVTSMGNVWSPITWPRTSTNFAVIRVRHAMALDERRAFFRPNRWRPKVPTPRQTVEEMWFAGVHSDVGGGYPLKDGRLWAITLNWMMTGAQDSQLLLDAKKWPAILNQDKGKEEDYMSRPHDSLTKLWKLAEFVPKPHKNKDGGSRKILLPALEAGLKGRCRQLEPGEKVHHSAIQCFFKNPRYRSETLSNAGLNESIAEDFLQRNDDAWVAP